MSLLFALLAMGALGACGAKIPAHNGYSTKSPWKKPKVLAFDDKSEARAEGDLDYAAKKRARWFAIDLPGDGDLEIKLEVSAAGGGGDREESDDDDDDDERELDLAMEVLDASFNVITKADAKDEDAGMQDKSRSLLALAPGRYYVHLYLQGRLDVADYELAVRYTPVTVEAESDFPVHVAYLPNLPLVPLHDDTPMAEPKKDDKKTTKKTTTKKTKTDPDPDEDEPAPTGGTVTAQIINVSVSGGGTQITINRGTEHGLADGRKGYVNGVKTGGSFTLTGCGARTCKGNVKASVDEVNRSGKATIK